MATTSPATMPKLHGRAFYESLGSPKVVLAPMVDQSEYAWRRLTRSFFPPDQQRALLAYTPMFHARLFADSPQYRAQMFQPLKGAIPSPPDPVWQTANNADPHLDGNPATDRPLFVQFCANDPDVLLEAARHVQPYCDAVDLNLGCPQGIARKGHYGAFLQEDQDLIFRLVNRLHTGLDIPVTAKMRVLDSREATLAYARNLLAAGASIITVHGRQRHQKGHATGLADWTAIRHLRNNLPPDTVIFANGNILQHADIARCLAATGADAVMCAEGNLHDPAIFTPPPTVASREYWIGRSGRGGWRMDAVMRRYLDIIHTEVLGEPAPERGPLFLPSDPIDAWADPPTPPAEDVEPPQKKRRRGGGDKGRVREPNLGALQPHLFDLLRPLISARTHVRDALARCKGGDIVGYEGVLRLVEEVTREAMLEEEKEAAANAARAESPEQDGEIMDDTRSSAGAIARCKRPFWVCQPYIRPLPEEAFAKGALALTKKEKEKLAKEEEKLTKEEAKQPVKVVEEVVACETLGGKATGINTEAAVCG